ncbi:MAG: cell division protein FtsA [Chloroflexi bacterium]|nr:cell division protein FtsA [Chloroflexota bacterium]
MRNHVKTITAIDVGTTKVFTILAQLHASGDIKVLGHSSVPCTGLRKGNVEDLATTTSAVRASVAEVQKQTGRRIHSAYIGVTGAHVTFENKKYAFNSIGASGVITGEDLRSVSQRIMASSTNGGSPKDRRVLHAIPMEYSVDGEGGLRNPVGLHGSNVEVEAHLISGGFDYIQKLIKSVEDAGVDVEALVLQPLASALSVLTPKEREDGAIIVDIGGGTTDLVGFRRGHINYTGVVPVAGFQFTNDIVQAFGTTREAAEMAKLAYGSADLSPININEEITLPLEEKFTDEETDSITIQRRDFCQLIKERSLELTYIIKDMLEESQMAGYPIVLTGGGSQLPGFQRLFEMSFAGPVRVGAPNGHAQVPGDLKKPAYATGVGIMLWAATEGTRGVALSASRKYLGSEVGLTALFTAWSRQVKRLMPWAV